MNISNWDINNISNITIAGEGTSWFLPTEATIGVIPAGYDNFSHFCNAQHYVYYYNDGLYSMVLLLVAVMFVATGKYLITHIEETGLLLHVPDGIVYDGGMFLIQMALYCVYTYIFYFFTMSYNALYPELATKAWWLVGIYAVGKIGIGLYSLYESKK